MPCPNCSCPSCLAVTRSSTSPPTQLLPPPSELTTTNRAPTDSEVAHSHATIKSARERVSVIQAMLDNVEQQKDNLEKQKDELWALVAKHRNIMSPLRHFPPELLAAFFTECVAMARAEDYYIDYRSKSLHCPPLMLMGVCSLWRKIVLDIPQLWARIWIAPPMIGSWVIRSKGLPLDLKLHFPWGHAPTFPALDALIPHAYRWEQIDFRLAPSSNSALASVKARLQSLKQLKLSFAHVTGTVDFCEIAPQLTEIWLKTIHEPVVIKLPWEQLRVCTLDNTGVALYILQQAKNLKTCHIMQHDSDPGAYWLSMPRDPHSRHPKLDTLTVDGWQQVADLAMSSFFSSLTLPSLRVLDVHFPLVMYFPGDEDGGDSESDDGYVDGPQFASRFRKFIKRSSRHLEQLRLICIPFTPSQFIDCLALARSVVSLEIKYDEHWDSSRNHGVNDEFLHALSAIPLGQFFPACALSPFWGSVAFWRNPWTHLSHHGGAPNQRMCTGSPCLRISLWTAPMGWPTEPRRPPSFHHFTSEGLNIEYGSYWGI